MSKRFGSYAALLLLSMSAFASAEDPFDCGKFQKKWEHCKRNRDCVLTQNVCGMASAVNRKFREAYDEFESCAGRDAVCPAVEPNLPGTTTRKLKAVCQVGQCVVE